ncbi:granzyme B(G,H)-like [Engraulis encrasicolus]|uniref:granzyme B(G,H)-like n=1 Tax=Engraulis encrasicolus TaxID=184585 RepID=UPI002FD6C455
MKLQTMLVVVLLSCLQLSGAVQSGIFGGEEAKPHSRPYMASLQISRVHTCGGVLIREDYVLTAAHCLNLPTPGYRAMEVVLGAHNISSSSEPSQQRIPVKNFYRHPNYRKPTQYDYDIMLLKLKRKAQLSKAVRVMALPRDDGLVPAGARCWVAGWGRKRPGSSTESVLREVPVSVVNQLKCKDRWQWHYNSKHMMCSSTNNGETGFCQGDSGGPLVCNTKVQGIVSFTLPDCLTKDPQVYTRTSAFLPWIKKIMGKKDEED